MATNRPVVVIVGPTGSGKSDLALKLAKKYNGEIICADSRTVYKGLDIGTAKPTREDQREIRHWGIDLIEPSESYSAYEFKNYALEKITDIESRGKMAIVVGGTGLYIDALVLNYSFTELDAKLKSKLSNMSTDKILDYCEENNINSVGFEKNRRHLISRVLQHYSKTTRTLKPEDKFLVVGITTDPIRLKDNLLKRIHQMIDHSVVEEATKTANKFGWECPGLSGNIYRLIHSYVDGQISKEQLIEQSGYKDYQLSRKQMTWLRRNKFIKWFTADNIFSSVCSLIESKPIL